MDIEEFSEKMDKFGKIYFKLYKKLLITFIKFIPTLLMVSFFSFIYFSILQTKGFDYAVISCLISLIFIVSRKK